MKAPERPQSDFASGAAIHPSQRNSESAKDEYYLAGNVETDLWAEQLERRKM